MQEKMSSLIRFSDGIYYDISTEKTTSRSPKGRGRCKTWPVDSSFIWKKNDSKYRESIDKVLTSVFGSIESVEHKAFQYVVGNIIVSKDLSARKIENSLVIFNFKNSNAMDILLETVVKFVPYVQKRTMNKTEFIYTKGISLQGDETRYLEIIRVSKGYSGISKRVTKKSLNIILRGDNSAYSGIIKEDALIGVGMYILECVAYAKVINASDKDKNEFVDNVNELYKKQHNKNLGIQQQDDIDLKNFNEPVLGVPVSENLDNKQDFNLGELKDLTVEGLFCPSVSAIKGLKFDDGKLRWNLVPMSVLTEIQTMEGLMGINPEIVLSPNEIQLMVNIGLYVPAVVYIMKNKGVTWDDIVFIYTEGAKKHGDHNWKIVRPARRYWDAAMRHAKDGVNEQDWGKLHWAHFCWNCIALRWFEKNGINLDSVSLLSNVPGLDAGIAKQ